MPRKSPILSALLLAVLAALLPAATTTGQDADAGFDSARALLEALERADQGIETLAAQIQYDKHFMLQGDTHRRRGDLLFRTQRPGEGAPERAFEINFNSLQVGGRLEQDRETWIFDGRWLVEMHPARKQFIKREVASKGATFDPLAIGEGPMPIPIGQKADEVLARYDARLAPPAEPFEGNDPKIGFVSDTWQLVLTPRQGVVAERDEKFKEIRIWYSRSGERKLLPRMARTLSRSGDVTYVQLINIKINGPVPPRAFDVTVPPADEHWQVQIERLPDPKTGSRR